MSNYSLLIQKLDAFIRKFYVNQLLRGALYTVGLVLTLFIVMNVLEFQFYFSTGVRKAMFWSFLAVTGGALWAWVAVPLMHYFRLGEVISHEKAAAIIGDHFADVKDKLLNILQLKAQSANAIHAELINASINQKSEEIKLVPFTGAIDLGKNQRYLKYALPPLLLLLFIFFAAPSILREGTKRLFNNSTKFEKPAPFKFLVNPDSLRAVQFSDFPLRVEVEGAALPNEVFIDLGGAQYRLAKEAGNVFSYRFTNVQRDTKFKLFGGGVESDEFKIDVIEKPNILSFSVKLNFPKYIGRQNEQLENVGDLVVPQGTDLGWVFSAEHTDEIKMRFAGDNQSIDAKRFDDELFQHGRRAMRDEPYKIFISNKNLPNADSVGYSITVVPDQVPVIDVKKFADSTNTDLLFFAGDASDDYGISRLVFNYQVKKAGGQQPMSTVPVPFTSGKQTGYSHHFNLEDLGLEPGDEVSYYFEVFDNDGVNGAKSARTGVELFKMPTIEEVQKQTAENDKEIKKDLEKALKESMKVQEDLKKLREKVLQQKEMDWQSKKEMEKLLDRQKKLDQQIEEARKNFEENMKLQENMEQNQQILEKQEKLQKMFEEALSPEMKELMKQIEEMLQNMNKEETLDKMEEMKMNNEEVTKELDRLEELFKQLEVEKMVDEAMEELEKLAEKQDKLGDETDTGEKTDEQIQKEQEDLNKEMEKIADKLEDAEKKNKELDRPKDIPDSKEAQDDIKKDQKDASDEMKKSGGDKKSKASKKQKSAAKKMKEMANNMKQQMSSSAGEQAEEDMAALRQLLENIIGLSFAQEDNMNSISKAPINTPTYVDLVQGQYRIKDDFKIVEDSLDALAKRVYQIEGFVLEKVTDIKSSIKNSTDDLEERNVGRANGFQQSSMKGLNDLALMLSETLNQMQNQSQSEQEGSGKCKKPGKSKGKGKGKDKSPGDKMSKGQGNLNEMMKGLKERLEKQGKDGNGGGQAKQYAQMARQQAELRKALDEKRKEKQGQGQSTQALDEIAKQMEETEKELVNKKLTNEMLKRQQDIMSRLLEEERAERQQEQDEQRQAESAKNIPPKMPPALEEYLKARRAEVDQFRTVSPALRPYYKALVEEYLKSKN